MLLKPSHSSSSNHFQVYEFFSLAIVIVSILSWIGEVFLQDTDSLQSDQWFKMICGEVNFYTMLYFIFEFSIRLLCSPDMKLFLMNTFNIIDLICIILFLVTTAVANIELHFDVGNLGKTGKFVRMMRFLRILRVCKLIRHLSNFQCLLNVVFDAMVELQFIFVLINITIIALSLLFFYAEKDTRDDKFSFFDSLEWTICAITSVRKVEGAPITHLGRFIGSITIICGVLFFSLPVPIIVNGFSNAYNQHLCFNNILTR